MSYDFKGEWEKRVTQWRFVLMALVLGITAKVLVGSLLAATSLAYEVARAVSSSVAVGFGIAVFLVAKHVGSERPG